MNRLINKLDHSVNIQVRLSSYIFKKIKKSLKKIKDTEIQEKRICTKIKMKRIKIKMKKQKMKRYLSDKKKILHLLTLTPKIKQRSGH